MGILGALFIVLRGRIGLYNEGNDIQGFPGGVVTVIAGAQVGISSVLVSVAGMWALSS